MCTGRHDQFLVSQVQVVLSVRLQHKAGLLILCGLKACDFVPLGLVEGGQEGINIASSLNGPKSEETLGQLSTCQR